MKATLEFDLDTPEGRSDHTVAVHARRSARALWEIDQRLRNELKYREHGEETVKLLEELRAMIREDMIVDLLEE